MNILVSYYASFKYVIFLQAPIPGGCNMELNVNNAPYLSVSEDFNLIVLEAAPARVSTKEDCDAESQAITHDFYHMYMPESDLTNETYFDMIKSMVTVEGILQNGQKVIFFAFLIYICLHLSSV